jgi:VanZ family protein
MNVQSPPPRGKKRRKRYAAFGSYNNPLKFKYILTDTLVISTVLLIYLMPIKQPSHIAFADKFVHFSTYVSLTLYWWRRFTHKGLLVVFLALFGLGIEILQHFTPPRTFSFYDMLANMTGIMSAWATALLYEWYQTRRKTES